MGQEPNPETRDRSPEARAKRRCVASSTFAFVCSAVVCWALGIHYLFVCAVP